MFFLSCEVIQFTYVTYQWIADCDPVGLLIGLRSSYLEHGMVTVWNEIFPLRG